MAVKNKRFLLSLCLVSIFITILLILISSFVLTAAPRGSAVRPQPSLTPSPTPSSGVSCRCAPDKQPLYDRFPKPLHTTTSFGVFNFFNDHGIDEDGANLTVWVSMYITADQRMQDADTRFVSGFTYVYIDAKKLERGEVFSYTMAKAVTANGRAPGGRICVYYEDPTTHDVLRNSAKYGGAYPILSPGNIVKISDANGSPAIPSPAFSQLLEFTLDVDPGQNADIKAFIDYDLSAVDTIAIPVYIFGGYDSRTSPDATSGANNNGFPCGKAYIGCQDHTHETTEGCPTQIVEKTKHGSVCISSLKYCSLAHNNQLATSDQIVNKSNWLYTCHKFDDIAAGFGITQTLLDLYFECARTGSTTPPCPSVIPPDVTTPTNVIYGCLGQFLLENHCLLDGSRNTGSRLDGPQCSALNRGLCIQPNYTHIPLPSGLSCARQPCPDNPASTCLLPCFDYSCFGNGCAQHPWVAGCVEQVDPISKSKERLCNDSAPGPYEQPGLLKNDYAGWARSKGERFYSFSLDEEEGGGNQQCLFSTQLDVVIFPRCNGNLPG